MVLERKEKSRSTLNTSIGLLLLLAMIAFFFWAAEVLIPIVVAVFVFLIVDPLIMRLEKWKIPRGLSAPVIAVLAIGPLYGLGSGIYRGVVNISDHLPQYSAKLRGIVRSLETRVSILEKGAATMLPPATTTEDAQKVQVVSGAKEGWTTALLSGVNSVFSIVTDLFLIPILAVFFLLEKKHLRAQFRRCMGPEFPLERVCAETARMVKAYFGGSMIVGLIASLGFYICFSVIGLENRFALALFAGFLNLVPIFGAFLGAVLPAAQAVLQFDQLTSAVGILILSFILHVIINNVVLPKIVGSRINVNASAATVGLIFWGWLWGGVGLLLAIPLVALIRIGLSTQDATADWANVLAENPEFPAIRRWRALRERLIL